MRKYVTLTVLLTLTNILWAQDDTTVQSDTQVNQENDKGSYGEGYEAGLASGSRDRQFDWYLRGCLLSSCTGCIGSYIWGNMITELDTPGDACIHGAASSLLGSSIGSGCALYLAKYGSEEKAALRRIPIGASSDYTKGFVVGYEQATRSRRITSAIIGSIIGATISVGTSIGLYMLLESMGDVGCGGGANIY